MVADRLANHENSLLCNQALAMLRLERSITMSLLRGSRNSWEGSVAGMVAPERTPEDG
jgi:hypothetical protein